MEYVLRSVEVLEPVLAQVERAHVLGQVIAHKAVCDLREEHLPAMTRR